MADIRHYPTAMPTLPVEQLTMWLPSLEFEIVEILVVHGQCIRQRFAVATTRSIACAPILEVSLYFEVDISESHVDTAIRRLC